MMARRSVVVGLILALAVGAPGVAAAKVKPAHRFTNCTDLHRTYRGGVAKPHATDHRTGGGHAKYAPTVSAALYAANISMDRDKDGIACEA